MQGRHAVRSPELSAEVAHHHLGEQGEHTLEIYSVLASESVCTNLKNLRGCLCYRERVPVLSLQWSAVAVLDCGARVVVSCVNGLCWFASIFCSSASCLDCLRCPGTINLFIEAYLVVYFVNGSPGTTPYVSHSLSCLFFCVPHPAV